MTPRTFICPKGHPKIGDNVYYDPTKQGYSCRTCIRESSKKSKELKRRRLGAKIRDLDLSSGAKKCSKCGKIKPLDKFNIRSDRKNGYQSWCKECFHKYNQRLERKEADKERWRSEPYRAGVRKRLWSLYGLTPKEFKELYLGQNKRCAICRKKLIIGGGKAVHPHIDHNHVTGEVRGLLCHACNMGLGQFCDDATALKRAIKYLKERNG